MGKTGKNCGNTLLKKYRATYQHRFSREFNANPQLFHRAFHKLILPIIRVYRYFSTIIPFPVYYYYKNIGM